jgi:ribosomal protein L24E
VTQDNRTEKRKAINTKDTNGHQFEWETCVVCGNSVEPGRGATRINHRGNTVNVCGPQCLRTFANEPDPYLGRLAKALRERAWKTEPEAAA